MALQKKSDHFKRELTVIQTPQAMIPAEFLRKHTHTHTFYIIYINYIYGVSLWSHVNVNPLKAWERGENALFACTKLYGGL